MKNFAASILTGLMVAVLVSMSPSVYAAEYPDRDIRFIVPYGPGGGSDPISRQFSRQLATILGTNVNVENKPGGAATIGISMIVKSKPDGYTIGHGTNNGLTYQPFINPDIGYKTPDDYQPIVKQADVPIVLAVRADAPWKTFQEFMADVKKNPGKIRVSTSGMRAQPDMNLQLLNMVAGTKIVSVPFTGGGGEALIALLGGRVEASATVAVGAQGHVKAGTIRVLAVFSKGRYAPYPNAMTAIEAGYDVAMPTLYCVIGPKGMPKNVQDKLFPASMQVIRSEEYRVFAEKLGYAVDTSTSPEALKAELVKNTEQYDSLIKFLDKK